MPKIIVEKQTQTGSKNTKTKTQKGGDVWGRVEPMGFDANEGISLLIYGQSGSGKTTIWGSFPGKILSIVCSGGNKAGELRSLNTPEMRKKIDKVTIEHPSDFMELIMGSRITDYETVVLDHVTGLQDSLLSDIIGKPIPEQKFWGMATQQQYQQCGQMARDMLREMLNLNCNRIIIGQERRFGDDDSSESELITPTISVALIPSLAGWLCPACDYVGHAFKRQKMKKVEQKFGTGSKQKTVVTFQATKEVEFCLRTAPHSIYTTKFRVPKTNKVPEVIVDPDYDKIMQVING